MWWKKAAPEGLVVDQKSVNISYYIRHYFKLLLFLVIPFFALSGLFSFRKLKLNFAEHAIIGGSLMLAGAMWYFFVIVGIYTSISVNSVIFNVLVWGFGIITFLQPARVYYQAAGKEYSTGAFLLRLLQWYSYVACLLFLVLLVIALFTGKSHIILS